MLSSLQNRGLTQTRLSVTTNLPSQWSCEHLKPKFLTFRNSHPTKLHRISRSLYARLGKLPARVAAAAVEDEVAAEGNKLLRRPSHPRR